MSFPSAFFFGCLQLAFFPRAGEKHFQLRIADHLSRITLTLQGRSIFLSAREKRGPASSWQPIRRIAGILEKFQGARRELMDAGWVRPELANRDQSKYLANGPIEKGDWQEGTCPVSRADSAGRRNTGTEKQSK